MIDTTELYIFWYLPVWPWPSFKVMEMQESKNIYANYLPKIWMKLFGLVNLNLVLSWLINIQRRNQLKWFCQNKTLTLACIHTFTGRFLSNWMWWKTPLNCTVSYQCEWPWPFLKITVTWEIRNLCTLFLANVWLIWMKCVLPWPVALFNFILMILA